MTYRTKFRRIQAGAHLTAIFQDNWLSRYQDVFSLDFIGAKDQEVVVTTGVVQCSIQLVTTNKATSSFLQAGCPSCHPTNSVSGEGNIHTSLHEHIHIFTSTLF